MSKIERSQNSVISKFNAGYSKIAQKLGLRYQDLGFQNIGPFPGGTFGRMNHVFASSNMPDIYTDSNMITFTAHGLAQAVLSEPLKCYCAVYVDKPIPTSIYVKQIRDSFRKKPIWIPYDKATRASDVYKNRMNWNGLVDQLNNDNELSNLIGKLRTENNVHGIDQRLSVGRGKTFPVRVNDAEDNHGTVCMIIPMGNRTLIATQHANQDPKDIEPALKAIQRITQIIQGFNYDQSTTGPMINDYAEDLLKIMPQETPAQKPVSTPQPPPPPASTPQQPQTGIQCSNCGHMNSPGQKFCGECGTKLAPQNQICSQCGAENSLENKFCGECGAALGASEPVQPPVAPPVEPAAPKVNMSDPLEQMIAEISGGKEAQWTVRYQTTKQEYEGSIWNIANEGYFIDMDRMLELGKKIGMTPHYQLFSNIKHVKSPTGQALSGGFMNLTITFNNIAPEVYRNRTIQVLVLPRDDNPEDVRVRLLASTEKDMNPDILHSILDILLNHPDQVKELFVWGMKK